MADFDFRVGNLNIRVSSSGGKPLAFPLTATSSGSVPTGGSQTTASDTESRFQSNEAVGTATAALLLNLIHELHAQARVGGLAPLKVDVVGATAQSKSNFETGAPATSSSALEVRQTNERNTLSIATAYTRHNAAS